MGYGRDILQYCLLNHIWQALFWSAACVAGCISLTDDHLGTCCRSNTCQRHSSRPLLDNSCYHFDNSRHKRLRWGIGQSLLFQSHFVESRLSRNTMHCLFHLCEKRIGLLCSFMNSDTICETPPPICHSHHIAP